MSATAIDWSAEMVADLLLAAEDSATARSSISAEWPGLDLATAYAAQDIALERRLSRGERLVGVKLGLTSRAKQRQMNVDTPSVAWLTDAMLLPTGEALPRERFIHPRAEPEIAFVMGEPLEGPGVTPERALQAVASVTAGIEVIDSRYAGFKFSLADAVADNNSSGGYVLSAIRLSPSDIDLMLEACLVEIDGHVVDTATGAAVYGHPGEALAFAANTLGERGHAIEAGWTVLTGGMTDAYPIEPGARVAAQFTHLGSVTIAGG